LKEDRLEQFMAVQAEISAAKLQRKIGRTIKVLVDEQMPMARSRVRPPTRRRSTALCASPMARNSSRASSSTCDRGGRRARSARDVWPANR
jgi:tRNA A37 methylthiotransferase MiaB